LMSQTIEGTGAAGEILDDALTIACGDGAVQLLELQRAGKKPVAAADLLRGFTIPKGTLLSGPDL
jgi:methionyl-tRNA formyltransferase